MRSGTAKNTVQYCLVVPPPSHGPCFEGSCFNGPGSDRDPNGMNYVDKFMPFGCPYLPQWGLSSE